MPAEQAALPLVVIACRVFKALLRNHLSQAGAAQLAFLDYGLHATPKKLRQAIQQAIDGIETPSLIVLGYGLCGNGLSGIQAGQHTLVVPRADDCIALLLGSYQAYRQEFASTPGTYYLTPGWLESGSDPLTQYQSYLKRYDRETADYVIDSQYKHYKRLAMVAQSAEDLAYYRPRAREIAAFCERWGMTYAEILGSDSYVRRLIETAALDAVHEDFLVIPPGAELCQDQFRRNAP
jgi:hypothetical protein